LRFFFFVAVALFPLRVSAVSPEAVGAVGRVIVVLFAGGDSLFSLHSLLPLQFFFSSLSQCPAALNRSPALRLFHGAGFGVGLSLLQLLPSTVIIGVESCSHEVELREVLSL